MNLRMGPKDKSAPHLWKTDHISDLLGLWSIKILDFFTHIIICWEAWPLPFCLYIFLYLDARFPVFPYEVYPFKIWIQLPFSFVLWTHLIKLLFLSSSKSLVIMLSRTWPMTEPSGKPLGKSTLSSSWLEHQKSLIIQEFTIQSKFPPFCSWGHKTVKSLAEIWISMPTAFSAYFIIIPNRKWRWLVHQSGSD